MEELSMNERRSIMRGHTCEGIGSDDNPRTVPISRRETTLRNKSRYQLQQPAPLSEDEVRQLPVAHQYSS
jgi:hypothetical protein